MNHFQTTEKTEDKNTRTQNVSAESERSSFAVFYWDSWACWASSILFPGNIFFFLTAGPEPEDETEMDLLRVKVVANLDKEHGNVW